MIKIFFFLSFSTFIYSQIRINEIDIDQEGVDLNEFIELYSTNPNYSLDDYILVFYNGDTDKSYKTIDLFGYSTNNQGYFVIGSNSNDEADLQIGNDNLIQNGPDAIAIYKDISGKFPDGSSLTTENLIDAIVYSNNENVDSGLLNGLGKNQQWNENSNGAGNTESLQLQVDGSFAALFPTPGTENNLNTYLNYEEVNDLTELRSGSIGNYYVITGEVYIGYCSNIRNQKYIQDSNINGVNSGAGILIDDSQGIITHNYIFGDGMTGLKGQLSSENGVLQFIPTADPGAPSSSGNSISFSSLSIGDLLSGEHKFYESQIIRINNISISEADGITKWLYNTNYTATDSSTNSIILNTKFQQADYLNNIIALGEISFNAIVSENNQTPQLIPLPFQNQLFENYLPVHISINNLIAYYPFNGNANDYSGNANHGIVNGATLTTDKYGNTNSAWSFDGINDYIDIGDCSLFNLSNGLTVSMYYKSNGTENGVILNHAQNDQFAIKKSQNSIRLVVKNINGSDYYTSATIDNNWNHYVAVYDGTILKTFINGSLINEASIPSSEFKSDTSNPKMILGGFKPLSSGVLEGTKGNLDELIIWDRALNSSEVENLYNTTLSSEVFYKGNLKIFPNPTSSKLYFTLNENDMSFFQVYDINGKLQLEKTVDLNYIDLSSLVRGVYFVKFFNKNNSNRIFKVYKK